MEHRSCMEDRVESNEKSEKNQRNEATAKEQRNPEKKQVKKQK